MDYHKWHEQRQERLGEERYQLGLERTKTGEGQLAGMIGSAKAKEEFSLTSLARGGPAQARRPYLVGEKGPELMVPDQSGTVIPNRKLQMLVKRGKVVPRARGGRAVAGGEPEENRSFGFRNTGGIKATAEREAGLVAAAASLGSPESYGGGRRTVEAGGAEPVHVIRGMKQAWTGPEGEYQTPQQANQAFIRAGQGTVPREAPRSDLSRVGTGGGPVTVPGRPGYGIDGQPINMGYDPVEGPKMRLEGAIKARSPETQALADYRLDAGAEKKAKAEADALINAEKVGTQNVRSLKNYVTTTRGLSIEKDSDVARDTAAAAEVGLRAGPGGDKIAIQNFTDRQSIRAYIKSGKSRLNFPEGYTVDMYLGALQQDQARWAEMVQEGKKMVGTTQPQTQVGTADNPGTAMQQLGVLGKKITPGWMTPGYYERTHPR